MSPSLAGLQIQLIAFLAPRNLRLLAFLSLLLARLVLVAIILFTRACPDKDHPPARRTGHTMSSEATYRTPVMSGELSEQDKKGLDLAIEQAEIGLSEGVSMYSILRRCRLMS